MTQPFPYGTPTPQRAPLTTLKTSTTGPTVMLVIGLVGLFVALIAVIGAVVGGAGLAEMASSNHRLTIAQDPDGALRSTITGLTPGREYAIGSSLHFEPNELTVTKDTANGAAATLTTAKSAVNISDADYSVPVLISFTASGPTYVVTYLDDDFITADTVVAVAEYAPMAAFGWNMFLVGGGLVVAFISGLVGLGLTIAGGVWRSHRKGNARTVAGGFAAPDYRRR